MATKAEALKKNGTLKKGYRYSSSGRIVKAKSATKPAKKKPAQGSLFAASVVKSRKSYTRGSTSNTARDNQRKALKPGKRISKNGNVYYEARKNRSDIKGRS